VYAYDLHSPEGMVWLKLLEYNRRFLSALRNCTVEGIEPVNEFVSSHNIDRLTI